jgi:ABC-type antimicrobial peptide transport system permease subunit
MTDLRLPLGLLLAFYGVILIATGATQGTLVVGININLWWGGVLLIFGAAMVLLARRASANQPRRSG